MLKQTVSRKIRVFGAGFLSLALLLPFVPAKAAEATGLSVIMKSEASLGGYLKRGTTNQAGTVTFIATAGKAQITRVSFEITGTGDPKFVERMQLANADGKPVGTAGKIQGNSVHFTDLGPLNLSEGQSRSFGLLMQLGTTTPLGKTYGLSIKSADAIHLASDDTAETKSGSAFPVQLPALPVADASGEAFLRAAFLSETEARKYFPIDKEMAIATLELVAFGGDITVAELRMKKDGDLKEKYLRDLTLSEPQRTVPLGGFDLNEGMLAFDTPIMVREGQTLRLQIATTIPVEAGELTNFFFEIDPKTDIKAVSGGKSVPVVTDRSPLRTRQLTVIAPSISMWRSWLSPKARHIQPGTKDVVLIEIEAQSTTDDAELTSLAVRVDSGIDTLQNLRLLKKPGLRLNQVTQDGAVFTFIKPGRLAAGKIENFQVIADIAPGARVGETIEIAIPQQQLAEGLPTYALEIKANPVVIGRSTEAKLQLKPLTKPTQVLTDSVEAPLYAFELSATESPAEITEIVLKKSETGAGNVFSRFLLKDAAGKIISKGSDAGDSVRFLTPFGIAKDASATLIVTADVGRSSTDAAITLSLGDHRSITATSLLSSKPAVVNAQFPLTSATVKTFPPLIDQTALIVRSQAPALASAARGQTGYRLATLTLQASGDDLVVDRLLFVREGEMRIGLNNLRLIGDDGFVAAGRLSDTTLIFDTPLSLDRDLPVTLTLLADLQPNAELNAGARFVLKGADQIRLRQTQNRMIPVHANFPLLSGEVRISAANESCATKGVPLCGRDYRDASAPAFVTFADRCALDAANAIMVHEGVCTANEGSLPDTGGGFADVSAGHPYAEAISGLKARGIINGTGNGRFEPESGLTRAELIKILVSAKFSQNEIKNCIDRNSARSLTVFFADVPADEWFAPYVCVAKSQDWIKGTPRGEFLPHEKVAVADAAKMIVNAYQPGEFTDGKPWFAPYLEFLSEQNALPETTVAVDSSLTRAETAELIWRLDQNLTGRPSREYDNRRHVLK